MEVLFVLFIFLGIITVVGHVIWLGVAAVFRWAFVDEQAGHIPVVPRHDPALTELVDLKTTELQIIKFYEDGKLNDQTYEQVISQIRAERTRLTNPTPKPANTDNADLCRSDLHRSASSAAPPPVVVSVVSDDEKVVTRPAPRRLSLDDRYICRSRRPACCKERPRW